MVRIRQLHTRSQNLEKHLSCDLCNNLLIDATKVTECFHTFCKECIHTKIREEELDCCPVCSIYLGVDPITKLRSDITLQNMRNKLFPIGKEEEARNCLPLVLMKASGDKLNMKAKSSTLTSKKKSKKIKRDIIEVEEEDVPSKVDPKEEAIFEAASNLPQAFFFDYDNLPPNYGIWTFKLRTTVDDEGSLSLPQITSCYAQMRDLSVPVSYLYNFLSKKVDSVSEEEVEIKCMGKLVPPTTTADELIQFWLTVNEKGDGTEYDRLMVYLRYGRKLSSPST